MMVVALVTALWQVPPISSGAWCPSRCSTSTRLDLRRSDMAGLGSDPGLGTATFTAAGTANAGACRVRSQRRQRRHPVPRGPSPTVKELPPRSPGAPATGTVTLSGPITETGDTDTTQETAGSPSPATAAARPSSATPPRPSTRAKTTRSSWARARTRSPCPAASSTSTPPAAVDSAPRAAARSPFRAPSTIPSATSGTALNVVNTTIGAAGPSRASPAIPAA